VRLLPRREFGGFLLRGFMMWIDCVD